MYVLRTMGCYHFPPFLTIIFRHGEQYRSFSAIIGWKALTDSIREFGEDHEFTKLVVDLKGKDPDDAFSTVPYEKGFTFLYYLERQIGREKWDKFIPHVGKLSTMHDACYLPCSSTFQPLPENPWTRTNSSRPCCLFSQRTAKPTHS